MYNKQKIRQVKLHIRRVLLEEWDPIGIADESLAQDEYDGYLGGTYDLLERRASEDEIVKYLQFTERVNMGHPGQSQEKLLAVAQALKCIPI